MPAPDDRSARWRPPASAPQTTSGSCFLEPMVWIVPPHGRPDDDRRRIRGFVDGRGQAKRGEARRHPVPPVRDRGCSSTEAPIGSCKTPRRTETLPSTIVHLVAVCPALPRVAGAAATASLLACRTTSFSNRLRCSSSNDNNNSPQNRTRRVACPFLRPDLCGSH